MTDWKKLKHLSGAAADVPRNIATLSGKAEYPAHEAAGALHNALVGAAKWSPASVPSIELLLETLPKSAHKAWLLMLAADIAGADHVRAWLAPSTRSGAPPAVDKALATLATSRNLTSANACKTSTRSRLTKRS